MGIMDKWATGWHVLVFLALVFFLWAIYRLGAYLRGGIGKCCISWILLMVGIFTYRKSVSWVMDGSQSFWGLVTPNKASTLHFSILSMIMIALSIVTALEILLRLSFGDKGSVLGTLVPLIGGYSKNRRKDGRIEQDKGSHEVNVNIITQPHTLPPPTLYEHERSARDVVCHVLEFLRPTLDAYNEQLAFFRERTILTSRTAGVTVPEIVVRAELVPPRADGTPSSGRRSRPGLYVSSRTKIDEILEEILCPDRECSAERINKLYDVLFTFKEAEEDWKSVDEPILSDPSPRRLPEEALTVAAVQATNMATRSEPLSPSVPEPNAPRNGNREGSGTFVQRSQPTADQSSQPTVDAQRNSRQDRRNSGGSAVNLDTQARYQRRVNNEQNPQRQRQNDGGFNHQNQQQNAEGPRNNRPRNQSPRRRPARREQPFSNEYLTARQQSSSPKYFVRELDGSITGLPPVAQGMLALCYENQQRCQAATMPLQPPASTSPQSQTPPIQPCYYENQHRCPAVAAPLLQSAPTLPQNQIQPIHHGAAVRPGSLPYVPPGAGMGLRPTQLPMVISPQLPTLGVVRPASQPVSIVRPTLAPPSIDVAPCYARAAERAASIVAAHMTSPQVVITDPTQLGGTGPPLDAPLGSQFDVAQNQVAELSTSVEEEARKRRRGSSVHTLDQYCDHDDDRMQGVTVVNAPEHDSHDMVPLQGIYRGAPVLGLGPWLQRYGVSTLEEVQAAMDAEQARSAEKAKPSKADEALTDTEKNFQSLTELNIYWKTEQQKKQLEKGRDPAPLSRKDLRDLGPMTATLRAMTRTEVKRHISDLQFQRWYEEQVAAGKTPLRCRVCHKYYPPDRKHRCTDTGLMTAAGKPLLLQERQGSVVVKKGTAFTQEQLQQQAEVARDQLDELHRRAALAEEVDKRRASLPTANVEGAAFDSILSSVNQPVARTGSLQVSNVVAKGQGSRIELDDEDIEKMYDSGYDSDAGPGNGDVVEYFFPTAKPRGKPPDPIS